MTIQLKVFNFNNADVRTIEQSEQIWWVAKDVCEVLDIKNVTQAIQALDEDERAMFNIGRQGETNIINEPGLYSLIIRSRKPEAKQFKRWITHEVIPSIRKTGTYAISTLSTELQAIFALDLKNQEFDQRLSHVENNTTINYGQQRRLAQAANEVILITLGGAESPAYRNNSLRGKTYSALWRDHKDYFQINSMRDTLVKDFDRALDRVSDWQPQGRLLREIENTNRQMAL